MGEPIGEKYDPGDDCINCWGIGKPFGDTWTPTMVYLTWAGLVGGLAPANKTFVGIQDAVTPCLWNFDDGTFSGHWHFRGADTIAYIKLKTGPPPDLGISGGLCVLQCTGAGAICIIS